MEIDKSIMYDTMNRPVTQSLFLEIGYGENAIYTLKESDYTYNGKVYYSLKKLYLAMEDPTEYEFASKYFLGWKHWVRICENRILKNHIDEWREELEVKLRSRGVKALILSAEQGNHQSAKWLADRGWDTRGAGRPTKLEKEQSLKVHKDILDEFRGDMERLKVVK